MRTPRILLGIGAALAAAAFLAGPAGAEAAPRVLELQLAEDVNPVTASFLKDGIARAERDGFDAVVIQLDTPGGLSESMREVVQAELAATVPVIVYVAPAGARAASAGVWIGQAADVLAMAPQTNIGSSTPIQLGGENIQSDLRRKVVNDAAASLRALATTHGRNAAWADRAVRQASNLTAQEALAQNVIDVVSPTLPALLNTIDGTTTVPKGSVLHTAGAQVATVGLSLWDRVLNTLINPNVIVLLMSLGVLAIAVEIFNPGLIFPAAFGVISLVLGLFGLQVLPFSWAGVLLLLAAVGFLAAEAFVTSHGVLAVAGTISFVLGALMLFDPAGSSYQVSLWVALGIGLVLLAFALLIVYKALAVRRRRPATAVYDLGGEIGVVRRRLEPEGLVFVHGELWQAHATGGEPVPEGAAVRVDRVAPDLTLEVSATGARETDKVTA